MEISDKIGGKPRSYDHPKLIEIFMFIITEHLLYAMTGVLSR